KDASPLLTAAFTCGVCRFVGWACSSAGEHYVDIVGVTGSIPVTPTILQKYSKTCDLAGHVLGRAPDQDRSPLDKPSQCFIPARLCPTSFLLDGTLARPARSNHVFARFKERR